MRSQWNVVEPQRPRDVETSGLARHRLPQSIHSAGDLQKLPSPRVRVASGLAMVGVLLTLEPADLPQLAGLEVPLLAVIGVVPPRRFSEVEPERSEQVLTLDQLSYQGGRCVLVVITEEQQCAGHEFGTDLGDQSGCYERPSTTWISSCNWVSDGLVRGVSGADPCIDGKPRRDIL